MIPGPGTAREPAVALIDGEHYPAVVAAALRELGRRFEFRAAVFLGGTEKIASGRLQEEAERLYGLPVLFGRDYCETLVKAIDQYGPRAIVDLSDEPVLGYEQRFRLISTSLARNVVYVGSDFQFSPVGATRLCASPSLSIVGTGKRVGKTAVSGYVARVLQSMLGGRTSGPPVVIVAMGRGGPAEPEVVDGSRQSINIRDLLKWTRSGRHGASDHLESAVLSGVATVGCRRCGGGMAGEPFVHNVASGVTLANDLEPGFIVLEGSGAALPPIATDARLLVAGAHQPLEYVAGLLGAYRVLTSDAVVITMAEEPMASADKVHALLEAIDQVKPGLPTVPVVFRPRPLGDVRGKRVAFFSTAGAAQASKLCQHLESEYACKVEMYSGNLADRQALRRDLQSESMARVEAVLTEIKAAAVDVVVEEAEARGLAAYAVDNIPVEAPGVEAGSLGAVVEELARTAAERFDAGAS